MKFTQERFRGRLPSMDARKLPDDHALVATNCRFDEGNLLPFNGMRRVHVPTTVSATNAYSIYRWSPDPGKDAEGDITQVENTTPVRIRTKEPHGLESGRRIFISGTGLSGLDDKVFSVTAIDPITVSLYTTSGSTSTDVPAAGSASQGSWAAENGFWFVRTAAGARFAPSPVDGDVIEPIFFTVPGERPAYTYSPIATQGASGNYPASHYWLGLKSPENAPGVTAVGPSADDPALVTTRAYVYSWFDEILGPGDISTASIIDVSPKQSVKVTRSSIPTGAWHITHWNIYRAVTSADGVGAYQLVKRVPISYSSFDDKNTDAVVARNKLLDHQGWSAPPETMQGMMLLANGVMVGYADNQVCPSEPYQPHAYDPLKRVTLPLPVVGIGAWGTNVVALTAADAHLVSGTVPGGWSQEPMNLNQGCLSGDGVVSLGGGGGVLYPSPDGLILIGQNGVRNITRPYITAESWRKLRPETMRAYLWEGMYVCFYDTGSTKAGFLFDPSEDGVGWVDIDAYATGGYVDPVNDSLYLVIDGVIYRWDADPERPLTYTYSSREFMSNRNVVLTCTELQASHYDDLTLQVFVNGSLRASRAVRDGDIHRIKPVRGRFHRYEVTGTAPLRRIDLAEHIDDLEQP